jgi:serralysin
VDLRAGHYSTITAEGSDNLAIAFGTIIEDAIGGAYADRIIGNEADNRLTGGGGADVFDFAADWGDDIIDDFVSGEDSLDFSAAGIGYSDLTVTLSGGNTTLAYGDDSVMLVGVETIGQSDFLLA